MNVTVRIAGLAIVLLLAPYVSYAADICSFTGDPVTSEETHSVSFGNVVVQRDTPIGAEIAEAETGAYSVLVGCQGDFVYRQSLGMWQTLSPLGNNIYDTNLPGVGIQIHDISWYDNAVPFDMPLSYPSGGALGPYQGYKVELYKTGDIQPGTLSTGTLARGSIVDEFYFSDVTLSGVNTITSAACSVTAPPGAQSLGQHDKSEFSGVGSTTDWHTFDIGLDCDSNVKINVRIDPSSGAVEGMTDVMNLDNDGSGTTASGIGVQLWFQPNGGSAVKFGQDTYYSTSSGGPETVQLQARYYQTAQNVTAGTANATATFTLTYK